MITCCTVLIYRFFVSGANILSSSLCSTLLMKTQFFQQVSSIYTSICHTEKQFICISHTPFLHQLLYVPSVITVWNTLPVGIRSSSSVSVFKHNLLHLALVLYQLIAIYMLPPISWYCTSYLTCIEKKTKKQTAKTCCRSDYTPCYLHYKTFLQLQLGSLHMQCKE